MSIGYWSSAGAVTATPCVVGSYGIAALPDGGRSSQGDACAPCPFNTTTTTDGSISAVDCVCQPSFIHDLGIDNRTECVGCLHGFNCSALGTTTLTADVQSGFWRPTSASRLALRCPHPRLCVGGPSAATYAPNSTATCIDALQGAFCTQCSDGNAYLDASSATCTPCAHAYALVGIALGSMVLAVIVGVVGAGLVARTPHRTAAGGGRLRRCCVALAAAPSAGCRAFAGCSRAVCAHPCVIRVCAAAAATTLAVKAKLLLGFALVVAQIGDVYRIRYPEGYLSLTSRLFAPLQLQLFGWIPGLHLRCFGAGTLQAQLLVFSLLPLGIVLLAVGVAKARCGTMVPALPFVLRCTFLFYPAVSSKGFQTLGACECFEQVDGTPDICFLPADYSVRCEGSHAPAGLLALGTLAVALFGVGVPLLYASLLYACRDAIRREAKTPLSSALDFLHGSLRPSTLWWPLVEAARALLLTGFLALVTPGQLFQLLCGQLVAIAFLVLQLWCAPYRTASNNLFAMVVNVSLVLDFVSSLGVQMKAEYGDPINPTLLSIALYAASFAIFPITLFSLLVALAHSPVVPPPQMRTALLDSDEAAMSSVQVDPPLLAAPPVSRMP